ncbi:class I SAM-dependent methyltransferase [Methylobacter sp. S3L5C]|uniref:class I SAM-dependent methyltransferase n=1 Tax=Methylobacter sp. S3L5C TaxID=2839024 RepID=UPI001FADBBF8|nr:class I SAM-dependent methyltransferase [Methylobacter sp. S3L5C]UOA09539.1 class I SAM-dependent methyltransferase [Methylobacter sp. S3L5C]
MNSKPHSSTSELVFGELQALQIAPKRLTKTNSWHGHIPFAFWLVKKLEPSIFVELGIHKSDSYSAFCQAVQLFSLDTACYGVAAWKEDDQAGTDNEVIYQKYSNYHDEQYASFSRLVRSTFDNALNYFADGSVDLLHIDGQHDYEEVKHNFEVWLPKLSSQAVVLFHDINIREKEFGVWKLFHELSQQYPGCTFSFIHSDGLGVLIIGDKVPDSLQRLCHLKDEDTTYVRLAFSTFGKFVEAQATESMLRSQLNEIDSANRQMIADRRKTEIESYKYEMELAAALKQQTEELQRQINALREENQEIEEVHRGNEMLMQSLSMRITKPLRDLNDLVRRLR